MTAFLVSCAAAVLTGMGIGGGGLLVIWLTMAAGTEPRAAQGINLLFFLVSALSSLPFHLRRRHIPYRTVALMLLSALPGAVLGCRMASVLPKETARQLFGWFLIVSGLCSLSRLLKKSFARRHTAPAGQHPSR